MVLRRLQLPGAVDIVRFADDEVVVVGIDCGEDCPVVDTPLSQLTELFPDLEAVVVGIVRERQAVRAALGRLDAGRRPRLCRRRSSDQVRRTLGIFGHEEQEATRVVIAGGGNIGLFVAAHARGARTPRPRSRSSSPTRDRAIAIADQLKRTVVLHGSALDQEILREADVAERRHAGRAHQRRRGQHPRLRHGQAARLPQRRWR